MYIVDYHIWQNMTSFVYKHNQECLEKSGKRTEFHLEGYKVNFIEHMAYWWANTRAGCSISCTWHSVGAMIGMYRVYSKSLKWITCGWEGTDRRKYTQKT